MTAQGVDANVGIGISLGAVVFIVAISLYCCLVKNKEGIPDEQFETKKWLLRTEKKASKPKEGCCSSLFNFCCFPCIKGLDLFKKFWSVKLTYKAITAIISNAFQLSAFAFAPTIPWTNTSSPSNPVSITQFFGAILLVYNKFFVEFWIVFALAILLMVVLFWALVFLAFCKFCDKYCCTCSKFGLIKKIIDFTLKAIGTVFDLVGFTLVTFFLSALNCSYPSDSPPTLDADPAVVCCQGLHIALVVCALLVILPMYFGTLFFNTILEDDYPWNDEKIKKKVEKPKDPNEGKDVERGPVEKTPAETRGFYFATDLKYQFFDVQITFVSASLCTFCSNSPYARLTILLITNIIYFFTSLFVRTSNFEKHNNLRTLSYLFSTWTVICGFIALGKGDENSYLSFGLWIGGLGLLFIFSIVILWRKIHFSLLKNNGLSSNDYNYRNIGINTDSLRSVDRDV